MTLFVLVLWTHAWFHTSYDYPQIYNTKVDCLYALHIEAEVNRKHGQCYQTIVIPDQQEVKKLMGRE